MNHSMEVSILSPPAAVASCANRLVGVSLDEFDEDCEDEDDDGGFLPRSKRYDPEWIAACEKLRAETRKANKE
jgi:hypothetical protein